MAATTGTGVRRDDRGAGTPLADQIAEVCHDLKQHIATGLLLSDPGEDVPDESLRTRMTLMHQQWLDAAELVSILDHGTRTDPGPVDLVEVAERCVAPVRAVYDVVLEVADGRHVVVGDEHLIRRAVQNLLDNACRATPSDGGVLVRVGTEDSHVFVEVSDDGPGFGLIGAGTGTGLGIVRAAVWAADGKLRIRTGPRAGTSVRLAFPAPWGVAS